MNIDDISKIEVFINKHYVVKAWSASSVFSRYFADYIFEQMIIHSENECYDVLENVIFDLMYHIALSKTINVKRFFLIGLSVAEHMQQFLKGEKE